MISRVILFDHVDVTASFFLLRRVLVFSPGPKGNENGTRTLLMLLLPLSRRHCEGEGGGIRRGGCLSGGGGGLRLLEQLHLGELLLLLLLLLAK